MFRRILSHPLVSSKFIFLIVILALPFLILGLRVGSAIDASQKEQQQALVRANKANIESFFQLFGESISILAQLESVRKQDVQTNKEIESFVEQWSDSSLIGGVAVTDEDGIVKTNYSVSGVMEVGALLSDRDYFIWAGKEKEIGNYYIGQAVISRFGASKDQIIVPVVSPIIRNGTFAGIVGVAVKLEPLRKRFLEMIKASDLTKIYLIDEQGILLHSNSDQEFLGKSFELLGDDIKKVRFAAHEGLISTDEYLIAFAPINLNNRTWMLITTYPSQRFASFSSPFGIQQTARLILLFLTILAFGLVTVRCKTISKKKE